MAEAVVVMGVSGSGKTTLGKRLARALGFEFADADAYHPQANVDKMAAGVPLTDADREPWLAALRSLIETRTAEGRPLVLGCSALKRRYREVLAGERAAGEPAAQEPAAQEPSAGQAPAARPPADGSQDADEPRVTFVYLRGDYDTILARMRRRHGHYMKADMLASQFRDLEEPTDAVTVDVAGSVPGALGQALDGLARRGVVPVAGRAPSRASGAARRDGPAAARDEEEDA